MNVFSYIEGVVKEQISFWGISRHFSVVLNRQAALHNKGIFVNWKSNTGHGALGMFRCLAHEYRAELPDIHRASFSRDKLIHIDAVRNSVKETKKKYEKAETAWKECHKQLQLQAGQENAPPVYKILANAALTDIQTVKERVALQRELLNLTERLQHSHRNASQTLENTLFLYVERIVKLYRDCLRSLLKDVFPNRQTTVFLSKRECAEWIKKQSGSPEERLHLLLAHIPSILTISISYGEWYWLLCNGLIRMGYDRRGFQHEPENHARNKEFQDFSNWMQQHPNLAALVQAGQLFNSKGLLEGGDFETIKIWGKETNSFSPDTWKTYIEKYQNMFQTLKESRELPDPFDALQDPSFSIHPVHFTTGTRNFHRLRELTILSRLTIGEWEFVYSPKMET